MDNTNTERDNDLDLNALDNLEFDESDIEYQVQEDDGCESGACKI